MPDDFEFDKMEEVPMFQSGGFVFADRSTVNR